ncbi:hypothetical protein F5I97DRAFT_895874 [Phlebopus sp. FC_14]|nr:hypothetical protein F5I97DRAFT_895874 [Phlebopus sp. FC_14]
MTMRNFCVVFYITTYILCVAISLEYDDLMNKQEKARFIQNYIEQQKAYISAYSAQDLVDAVETPSKQQRSRRNCDDAFGFDTPVLRPRVGRLVSSKPEQKARSNGRANHDATASARKPAVPDQGSEEHSANLEAKSDKENQETTTKKKTTTGSSSSKAPSPPHSDDEREARLAERRERKRKRRAILEQDDDSAATAKSHKGPKGKNKKSKKASTPASLALLHGFSATNIKKNRLTLKTLPSLGVFNKGKASVKTKIASAIRRSASQNNGFLELAFLSKTRTNDETGHVKDCDIISLSSSSSRPTPKKSRCTNHHSRASKSKEPRTSERSPIPAGEPLAPEDAKSELWDIEIQSTGTRVHSDAQAAASLVMDLHTTNWFTSGTATRGTNSYPNVPKPSPEGKAPITRVCSTSLGSILTGSESCRVLCERFRADGDSSSLHPSQSASQVGLHRTHDHTHCTSSHRLVSSKFFAQSGEVPLPNSTVSQGPQLHTEAEVCEDETGNKSICYSVFQALEYDSRVESITAQTENKTILPTDSVVGAPQPFDFRTPYDLPLLATCNGSCGNARYASVHEAVAPVLDRNAHRASMITGDILPPLDWQHQPYCHSPPQPFETSAYLPEENSRYLYGLSDDAFDNPTRMIEPEVEKSDPFTWTEIEHYDELHGTFSVVDEAFTLTDEHNIDCCGHPYIAPPNSQSFEDEDTRPSVDEDLGDDNDYEGCQPLVDPNFLQGRTLLLGLSPHSQDVRSRNTTGLLDAEVEVANRLRNHWRPQKL